MPAELTEQINIRFRPDEKELIEETARRHSKTVCEWARETLIAASGFSPEHRMMLAELLSLRNGIFRVMASIEGGKPLAPDSVSAIVADADEKKFVMADRRIVAKVLRFPRDRKGAEESRDLHAARAKLRELVEQLDRLTALVKTKTCSRSAMASSACWLRAQFSRHDAL
jgi:hypothetical protein